MKRNFVVVTVSKIYFTRDTSIQFYECDVYVNFWDYIQRVLQRQNICRHFVPRYFHIFMCLFIRELQIMIMERGCRHSNNYHLLFIIAVKVFIVYETTRI